MSDTHLPTAEDPLPRIQAFINRWNNSGAAERANYQLFLSELCDILGVPRPEPTGADDTKNAYVFERAVVFQHGDGNTSTGRIDLYKRGCFVLEAKQGKDADAPGEETLSEAARELKRKLKAGTARRGTAAWDDAMLRARGQAEQYCRALPATEGRPPFLIVVDVGHSIELFSEFSCTGGTYIPFPSPGRHRIFLRDLEHPDIRERLRLAWTTPHDLDPTKRSARVTREIASSLAKLAVTLEKDKHDPHVVAAFLMRALFTMFAEDVGLLARNSFSSLLLSLRDKPQDFVPVVEELWGRMDRGGYSVSLRTNILQFNGGLFESATALPLNQDQLQLLIEASQSDWRDVEPAIFGTLLERALAPEERHKLGAHYTPRAYVERLVMPTIVEPIRAEWETVRTAAVSLVNKGEMPKAVKALKAFHQKLCHTRILDPACGSGNFLYVTLEHLKRVEGEVLDTLNLMGEKQVVLDMAGETVGPHQFLGLEINPRAAAIAELVLWIGTLQWHFRNRGNVHPPQPIIRNFHNIQCKDALIEYDKVEPVLDEKGQPVTRWDGRTTKPHPVTGREVPDETSRIPVVQYINPRPATWPETDYVVGNPPFIGPALMRQALGDGYTETVRTIHSDVGESSDFVMYWWNHAAKLVREGKIRRFGFVTTNSLRQTFNRRVLETHLSATPPLSLLFAIPDHPWVDASDGAAVRIAMTVASAGMHQGGLYQIAGEKENVSGEYEVELNISTGSINSHLSIGTDIAETVHLRANEGIAVRGICVLGSGFVITPDQAKSLGLGSNAKLAEHIKPYLNGRDLAARPRDVLVIDLQGLTIDDVLKSYPAIYQWVLERVKPERDHNREQYRRDNWWVFGRKHTELRSSLAGLARYIATPMTAKHRLFQFIDAPTLPDQGLISIALDDAYYLGVMSSRIHICWALKAGGRLGVGNDPRYNNTLCFDPFPFPDVTESRMVKIRSLAEQLDAHRKRQQTEHPDLTMTGMYNVLEKLRANEPLTAAERKINEQGLVSVLKQLHDDLDAAVFEAYGWPTTLTDEQILEKLVALNAERAAEEARGQIHWLRPDYQCRGDKAKQTELDVGDTEESTKPAKGRKAKPAPKATAPLPWPKTLPDQIRLLREVLSTHPTPVTAKTLAKCFSRARVDKVEELLQTLVTLGQARAAGDGMYVVG